MSAPVAAPAPLPARVVASDPPTGARAGAKRKYERKTWRLRGEPAVNVLDEPGLRALLCAAMAIGRPDDLVFNNRGVRHGDGAAWQTYKCKCHRTGCKFKARYMLDRSTATATFESAGEHSHGALAPGADTGLTPPQKAYVEQRVAAGAKPKFIHRQLEIDSLTDATLRPPASRKQVQGFCRRYGKKISEGKTMRTLKEYKEDADKIPFDLSEPDQPACLSYKYNTRGEERVFRFIYTTPTLLRLMLPRSGFRFAGPWGFVRGCDGTYKTNYKGFPVLVFGVVDYAQKFHLVALMVTYQEKEDDARWGWSALERHLKVLDPEYDATAYPDGSFFTMSDADKALRAGERAAYGNDGRVLTQLMCYYHMKDAAKGKTASEKYTSTPLISRADFVESIGGDLKFLHEIPYLHDAAHEVSLHLLMLKWESLGQHRFARYFHKTWTSAGREKWSRAHVPEGLPATNNGCERFNRDLKELQLHQRPCIGALVTHMKNELASLSREHKPHPTTGRVQMPVVDVPEVPDEAWQEAQLYRRVVAAGGGDDLVVRFSANRSLLPAYETVEKLRARAAADETVTNKQSRLRAMKALNDKDAEDAVALWEASDAGVDAVVALVGCPSVTDDAIVTQEELQTQNQLETPRWSFARFAEVVEAYHLITPKQTRVPYAPHPHIRYTCSCKKGQDRAVCKHVLYEGVRRGEMGVPDESSLEVLGMQAKRGRPKKTKPRLCRQTGEDATLGQS